MWVDGVMWHHVWCKAVAFALSSAAQPTDQLAARSPPSRLPYTCVSNPVVGHVSSSEAGHLAIGIKGVTADLRGAPDNTSRGIIRGTAKLKGPHVRARRAYEKPNAMWLKFVHLAAIGMVA